MGKAQLDFVHIVAQALNGAENMDKILQNFRMELVRICAGRQAGKAPDAVGLEKAAF
jgi:hypothetical protein